MTSRQAGPPPGINPPLGHGIPSAFLPPLQLPHRHGDDLTSAVINKNTRPHSPRPVPLQALQPRRTPPQDRCHQEPSGSDARLIYCPQLEAKVGAVSVKEKIPGDKEAPLSDLPSVGAAAPQATSKVPEISCQRTMSPQTRPPAKLALVAPNVGDRSQGGFQSPNLWERDCHPSPPPASSGAAAGPLRSLQHWPTALWAGRHCHTRLCVPGEPALLVPIRRVSGSARPAGLCDCGSPSAPLLRKSASLGENDCALRS